MPVTRRINVDLPLVIVASVLTIYGLAIVFSAGQTDVKLPYRSLSNQVQRRRDASSREQPFRHLLAANRDQRIDPRCAMGGHVRRDQRRREKDEGHRGEGERISRRDAVQQSGQDARASISNR